MSSLYDLPSLGAAAGVSGDWPDDPAEAVADHVAADGELFAVRDPDDGAAIARLPADDVVSLNRRIVEAHAAWARGLLATHRRRAILHAAADLVAANSDLFARTIAREGIKTQREAEAETARCVGTLRLCAEAARQLGGETVPFDDRPGLESRLGLYRRRPVGVVAAITPYNDPLNLVAHKVGPALAAGNAVVLKPDERTPLSALLLARALDEAGLPDGLLQVALGSGASLVRPLVAHEAVRMVSVTGGRRLATRVAQAALTKKLVLELGGVCPAVVLADADLDLASDAIVAGAFGAAGQNCLHTQLVLVERPVYAEMKRRLCEGAAALQTGPKSDPATDVGPMIDPEAASRVSAMVDDAVHRGARVLCGADRPSGPTGTRLAPTLLEDTIGDCALRHCEVFGPVTVLAPVENRDEALRQAALTDGLQAGLFTAAMDSSLRSFQLPHGSVAVNDVDLRYDGMPFGGTGAAGIGREGPLHAALEMSETQVLSLRTVVPSGTGGQPGRHD